MIIRTTQAVYMVKYSIFLVITELWGLILVFLILEEDL